MLLMVFKIIEYKTKFHFQWLNGFLISAGIDRTGEYIWIHDDANRTKFLENFISLTKNVTVD